MKTNLTPRTQIHLLCSDISAVDSTTPICCRGCHEDEDLAYVGWKEYCRGRIVVESCCSVFHSLHYYEIEDEGRLREIIARAYWHHKKENPEEPVEVTALKTLQAIYEATDGDPLNPKYRVDGIVVLTPEQIEFLKQSGKWEEK